MPTSDARPGTVIAVDARGAHVDLSDERVFCRVRGRFYEDLKGQKRPIAPGDRVQVAITAPGEGVVEEIAPRKTRLSRISADGETEQVIAANVDRVAIVVAVRNPPLRPGLIDRLVVAARNQQLEPLIVVNKIDLGPEEAEEVRRIYEELGLLVILVSAKEGVGVERLAAELAGRTTVLTGHSGVGKSSLLNRIDPEWALKTGEVSRQTTKGRHTTTRALLLPLRSGGYVIDTPGIRSFGLYDLKPTDLDIFFAEFDPYLGNCRFSDCTHSHEPKCAVRDAVAAGAIAKARYDAYRRILDTLDE